MSQPKGVFYIHWLSLALGILLGIFGVLATLLARTNRKDKFHSALLGCAISMTFSLFVLKFYYGR